MKIRFVAHFADGEVIEGRPFVRMSPQGQGTGWKELPDKPIIRLSLVNPHGDMITLQGYEEYNFMVESLQALGMASYVSNVYLMGARDGKVTVYRVGAGPTPNMAGFQLAPAQNVRAGVKPAPTNPLQVGDITARVIERGKEYLGAETTGWRKGIGLKSSNV